jgi:spore coat polysaccharide biosynthesis predicted glycosyltransferase SpsG
MISLGGADPHNTTGIVVAALKHIHNVEVRVVIGAANPHLSAITAASRDNSAIRIEVDIADMRKLMEWPDFAIIAAGSICWELAFMGVPALGIILADNQRTLAADLEHRGVLKNLGWHHELDSNYLPGRIEEFARNRCLRDSQAAAGPVLVDGRGSRRVVQSLRSRVPC